MAEVDSTGIHISLGAQVETSDHFASCSSLIFYEIIAQEEAQLTHS